MKSPAYLAFGAVILALALAGCQSVAGPAPVDRFYRVAIPQPAAAGVGLPGTVLVGRLDADGLMRERPVVYSADAAALSLAQHEYEYWIEPPARLLQVELVRYLRSAGIAQSVVTPALRIRPDYEVVGAVRRFERLIGRSGPRVAVSLDLALIDRNGDRLRVVDTYSAEIECGDATLESSVAAFNRALTGIFAEFLADIRQDGATT